MKLSLVVAQGIHAGKVIPVVGSEFVIGRDPQCQLRPASPAISKQHCALTIRGDQVFVRDCGSTNGTFVNDEQVAGDREVKTGDRLRVGPLEFSLKIEVGVPAVKPVARPAPTPAAKPALKAAVGAGTDTDPVPSGPTVLLEPGKAAATTVVEGPGGGTPPDDPDHLAAMLLGLDDPIGSTPTVEQMSADPTTVMEMPAFGAKPGEPAKKEEAKKPNADSASAAAEVLSKYMRRPRT